MSLSRLIRQCADRGSIQTGKAIHARIILSGSRADVQTDNHLLTMYAKFGCIEYARKVFDEMPARNIVTWTALISSYSQTCRPINALNCFRSMVFASEMSPNEYTYVAVISACAQLGALRQGKEIHGRFCRTAEIVNCFVDNCLINFYGKCGSLSSARVVFDNMAEPNTVTCVSLMTGYMQCGENVEGLRLFLMSLRMGVMVNEFSYGGVLAACAALEDLELGRQVQCLAIKLGIRMDEYVVTNLVNFYAKCGELEFASRVLREAKEPSVAAMTALIGGFVHLGKHMEAIGLFHEMHCGGLKPSEQTFASAFGAFGKEKDIGGGMQLHCLIVKMGFELFTFVANSLLDFYAKAGCLDESFKIFYGMIRRDIVSWNALIAGCIDSGQLEVAVMVIQKMLLDGLEPNIYTYSSILSICCDLPAMEWGKQTHCRVVKPGFDSNMVIGSALVDMYAKCGQLSDAMKVFNSLPDKNLVAWNAMVSGYAQHGFGREALEVYDTMLKNGLKPDNITFVAVLSACAHAGALDEALRHFGSMVNDFGIMPRADHLACIVSLLSRKGQTKEAYEFIRSYPTAANKVVWRCLLSGCTANKDLELAEYAAKKISSIDPNDASALVMLSNIYADSDMWSEASQVRNEMEGKMAKKETGYSWTG